MTAATSKNVIVVCDQPDERNTVLCCPFEPDDPDYAGERFLALSFRGVEEGFVVLSAEQAAHLAELLTKDEVSR